MLTPQDSEAFRATVLRRAARIERRRRRTRALMWVPGAVALVLAGVLVTRPDAPSEQLTAGFAEDAIGEATDPVEATAITVVSFAGGRVPWAVVGASDGGVWVLERRDGGESAVSRIEGDQFEAVATLPEGSQPDVLVAGADDALWMTDPAGGQVVRVGFDGTVSTWATDSTPSPTAAFGFDGRLWFAEPAEDRLTGMSADGDVIYHQVPEGRAPDIVAVGPDGSIFFGEASSARVGSVSPRGTITEYDLAEGERVVAMTSGPGPALWMALQSPSGARLARLDGRGNLVGEALDGGVAPKAIGDGSDGRLWYSTADEDAVRQQALSGPTATRIDRPLSAASWAMGADGAMWAVDRGRGVVVRIVAD